MPEIDPRIGHYAQQIMRRAKTLLLILDGDGKIVMALTNTDEMIGYSQNELRGMDFAAILRGDSLETFLERFERTKAKGEDGEEMELAIATKKGLVHIFRLLLFPIQGMEGQHFFCIHGDNITADKDDQWAIEMMNKKLNILGSATRHDVLNSLTGLFGYLELADVRCKDENVTKFIRKAKGSAETVKKQIEFTRAYQELGSKKPDWIDVGDIVRTAYSALNEPRIPMQANVDGLEVFADPMLEKVFYNILDNAHRHAEAKNITIGFSKKERGLEVYIEDDGRGIRADEKEFVFKRGYGKNTGFGLYLSREILEITGMKIFEDGEEGRGARFVIIVPEKKFRFKS